MPRRPMLLLSVLLVIIPTIAESSESFQGRISFYRDDLKILKNNGFDFIEIEGGECLAIVGAPALPQICICMSLEQIRRAISSGLTEATTPTARDRSGCT